MNDYKSKMDLKYKSVNELWKDIKIPYITRYEVRKALDKLTFVFGKKRFAPPNIRYKQQKPRIVKSMICLSGDPQTLHKGWRDLIHTFSHWNYNYRNGYKNHFGHSYKQAELEFEITKFVISSGWLEGGLKPKVVVLSKDEKRLEKIKHLQNLIEKWQRKQKFANTFIRKYHKKLKYHTKK
jgi:hypothetical protein